MIRLTEAEYRKISKDYRGIWEGKRSVFAGCIMPNGGTRLAIEGRDFEIVKDPDSSRRLRAREDDERSERERDREP